MLLLAVGEPPETVQLLVPAAVPDDHWPPAQGAIAPGGGLQGGRLEE